VTQEFDLDAGRFLAGIAEMLAGTELLANSIDKVSDSSSRMGGVTEVADAAAVVAMEAATAATRDLTDATRDLASARRRAADAGTGTGFAGALKNLFAGPGSWMKLFSSLPGILTAVAAGGPAAALAIGSIIQGIAELGSIIGPAAIGLGAPRSRCPSSPP
jgi:hypothetical protein